MWPSLSYFTIIFLSSIVFTTFPFTLLLSLTFFLSIFNNNKQQKTQNIHSTIFWDINMRSRGKLIYTHAFSPLWLDQVTTWKGCQLETFCSTIETFSVNNLVENWTVWAGRHLRTKVWLEVLITLPHNFYTNHHSYHTLKMNWQENNVYHMYKELCLL